MRRRDIASGALLLCVLAAWSCAAQQKQSRHEFFAVLIDTGSKKPVPHARIILAPKKEGKLECTIDTSLTGVSNDRGEVRIPNVEPGEYVVFQNPSGIIKPELKGKVVTWCGSAEGYNLSLGPVLVKKGTLMITLDGHLAIANGYMETGDGDLGISTTAEGAFLTVRVPDAGSAPVKIEINTNPGK
jgi:hypothetical protein